MRVRRISHARIGCEIPRNERTRKGFLHSPSDMFGGIKEGKVGVEKVIGDGIGDEDSTDAWAGCGNTCRTAVEGGEGWTGFRRRLSGKATEQGGGDRRVGGKQVS